MGMDVKLGRIIIAVATATLAACATAPAPKAAASKPTASASNEAPYRWMLGNAPQAHKDMVAEFGKPGLKPGEYVWAAAVPVKAKRASSSIC